MPNNYNALTKEDYQNLIFNTPLNSALKMLFNPIQSADDYTILKQYIEESRNELFKMAQSILYAAKSYPLNHLPIIFIIDSQNSSGGKFLRWRDQSNGRSGKYAWDKLIINNHVPIEIRSALRDLEKDRIAFNMQMSILNFILRQCRECSLKIQEIDTLFMEHNKEVHYR
ncbi:DUF3158 family protein [Gallibacterium melopsittaci]|uniref:DUF3158 family protein n=1 Tax=Gallibacterium melopsittaci TaxID=516063 RepID=A0ABV6HXP8_9PAST